MYVFQLFDYYGASGMCLLWYCFFETVVIAYVYGYDKVADNFKQMIGFSISRWFIICWRFLTPLVTGGIFLFQVATHKPVKYNNVYEYPTWAIAFGWSLALSSMIVLPLHSIYTWFTTSSDTISEKWAKLTAATPSPYIQRQAVAANDFESRGEVFDEDEVESLAKEKYPDILN